jgi:hypothetical protein
MTRGLNPEDYVDGEVQVTGVASTGVDMEGRLTDLTLLAADVKALKIVRAAPDPKSLPTTALATVLVGRGPVPEHRMRLHGAIESLGEAEGFRFSDSSGFATILSLEGTDPRRPGLVDLVAFVDRTRSEWTMTDARPTFKTSVSVKQGSLASITNVAALHQLTTEEAQLQRPVSLDCTLTYYDPSWRMAFVEDIPAGFTFPCMEDPGRALCAPEIECT